MTEKLCLGWQEEGEWCLVQLMVLKQRLLGTKAKLRIYRYTKISLYKDIWMFVITV